MYRALCLFMVIGIFAAARPVGLAQDKTNGQKKEIDQLKAIRELQTKENKRLEARIEILEKEFAILRRERARTNKKNEELWKKVERMEKELKIRDRNPWNGMLALA